MGWQFDGPFASPTANQLLVVLLACLAIAVVLYLVFKVFQLLFWLLRRLFRFLGRQLTDFGRLLGSGLALPFFLIITVAYTLLGRDAQTRHYSQAMGKEALLAGRAAYGFFLGNWLALFGLRSVAAGLEQRLPEAVASAPAAPAAGPPKSAQFDGYSVTGSLRSGGSGAKLYVARPLPNKLEQFRRAGRGEVAEVVIKSFALDDGSNLPDIVRESRGLEFARAQGFVLEHGLDARRFYYVTPYVPGEDLGVMTARLHAASLPEGLDLQPLRQALGYVGDLLEALQRYHRAGFWHKDVKPANVVVANGRAHLVDLGLVTPLQSTLTLTTHGTEYYRDPELVRQALRGARVGDVDGVRFDLYGVGAVLYSVIENSFPAHGSLSPITKRCPEAVRWIVRRAMSELHHRYPDAAGMLADVRAVAAAPDPFQFQPVQLPSFHPGPPPPPPAA